MKKKINFTGRVKIPANELSALVNHENGTISDFKINLDRLRQFSPEAAMFLEVGAAGSLNTARLSLGRVDGYVNGKTYQVDQGLEEREFLTLKIVETSGKILGVGGFRPSGTEGGDTESLLSFVARDLGSIPWMVQFEPSPILCINKNIPNARQLFHDQPQMRAVVLPVALRSIYEYIYFIGEEDPEEEGSWAKDWINMAGYYNGNEEVPVRGKASEEDVQMWIQDVISDFCDSHGLLETLVAEEEV